MPGMYTTEVDTPMRTATKQKPRPDQYTVIASFPERNLHDHTDSRGRCPEGKEIPMECCFAKTSERVVQLDFVGPLGKFIRSIHLEIQDFVDMNEECAGELRLAEIQFSIDCGVSFLNLIPTIHGHLAPSLRKDLEDDFEPSPIAGTPRDQAISEVRAAKANEKANN